MIIHKKEKENGNPPANTPTNGLPPTTPE